MISTIEQFRALAPAKINLGLEVLERRADGFHNINTVFATIALADELVISLRNDTEIVCVVEGAAWLETDERNLAVRALTRIRDRAAQSGRRVGFDLLLRKVIPAGGGLGGGSSDAATALRGGIALLGDDAGIDAEIWMRAAAAALGSDVAFFLRGGVARGGGRGELLEELGIELPWHILLVNPGIHVATPWAYKTLARSNRRPASDLAAALRRGLLDTGALRRTLVNDFEPVVFARHPRLAAIRDELLAQGALLAMMSGSGSTMFGLFADHASADHASKAFAEEWTGITSFLQAR